VAGLAHHGHNLVAEAVTGVAAMVGPVEALEGQGGRGLRGEIRLLVAGEADPVLQQFRFAAVALALDRETQAIFNPVGRPPDKVSVVGIGYYLQFDCRIHLQLLSLVGN
jgi:hypothetical protein